VTALTPVRLWLRRLFLVAVWFVVYWLLSDPWDTWLGIATVLAFGIWLYNRVSGHMKLPTVKVKFQRVETITLTHILLALLLLVMLANHSELVDLKKATIDVQDSVTDLQNNATENTDEIKSSLDDLKDAIEASQ
jgi:thiol:disulfide interchange protein